MGKRKRRDEALTNPTIPPPSSSRRRHQRRRHRRRKRSPPPPAASPEWRDWSSPPGDVLLAILSRTPHADVLRGAGQVCAAWRRVAVSEPALWRRIQLFADDDDEGAAGGGRGVDGRGPPGWRGMARAAVDRSAGRCESFRGRADMGLLAYLAARSPSLRAIRVTSRIYVREEEELVAGVIRKLPLLERLELSGGGVFPATTRVMRALLGHCPALEVLDAGGCATDSVMSRRVRERCEERIRHLRLPPVNGCCGCCMRYAQRYADEHDDEDDDEQLFPPT